MKKVAMCLLLGALCAVSAKANTINLGTADPFAVLAGSTVTNTGPTVINGNLGLWPGTSITGFPPGIVNGAIHDTDAVAMQAQAALTAAFDVAAGLPCTDNLTGQNGWAHAHAGSLLFQFLGAVDGNTYS